MNKSESIGALAMALNKVQAALTGAVKDSNNPFFKSQYADLESVWESIRKVFTDNGLSIAQFPSEISGRPALTNMLMHETGEWIATTVPVISGKEDAQGYVAAYTYFRRMSLSAIVGQVAVDDDGNSTQRQSQPAKAQGWQKPVTQEQRIPNQVPGMEGMPTPTLPMFIAQLGQCGTLSALSACWTNHKQYLNGLSDDDLAQAEHKKDEMKKILK